MFPVARRETASFHLLGGEGALRWIKVGSRRCCRLWGQEHRPVPMSRRQTY